MTSTIETKISRASLNSGSSKKRITHRSSLRISAAGVELPSRLTDGAVTPKSEHPQYLNDLEDEVKTIRATGKSSGKGGF